MVCKNWRERNARDLVEAEIFPSLASLVGATYPAKQIESAWYRALTLHPHGGLYLADEDVMNFTEVGRDVEDQCRTWRARAIDKLSQRIAAHEEKQAIGLFNPL